MPTIVLDAEQADLIEASCAMFEAALTARVKRVDPDKVLSNSFQLQAHKLATVRRHLASGEPPSWADLDKALKDKALNSMRDIIGMSPGGIKDAAWKQLRGIINAADFQSGNPPGQLDLSVVESERDH